MFVEPAWRVRVASPLASAQGFPRLSQKQLALVDRVGFGWRLVYEFQGLAMRLGLRVQRGLKRGCAIAQRLVNRALHHLRPFLDCFLVESEGLQIFGVS